MATILGSILELIGKPILQSDLRTSIQCDLTKSGGQNSETQKPDCDETQIWVSNATVTRFVGIQVLWLPWAFKSQNDGLVNT